MKPYNIILFDLDGTLTDPVEGITNSVMYALKRYDIVEKDRNSLLKFIGPPLVDSFMQYYGFDKEKALQALAYYREYFEEKGWRENEVYAGMADMLKKLKSQGKRLLVATSKPDIYANRILEHFDLVQYFEFVAGASMDLSRSKKSDVIKHALDSCDIKELSQVVMVGDRMHDVMGAKQNSIDSIGVEYGYGDYKELSEAGATYIIKTVQELTELLSGIK